MSVCMRNNGIGIGIGIGIASSRLTVWCHEGNDLKENRCCIQGICILETKTELIETVSQN